MFITPLDSGFAAHLSEVKNDLGEYLSSLSITARVYNGTETVGNSVTLSAVAHHDGMYRGEFPDLSLNPSITYTLKAVCASPKRTWETEFRVAASAK